MKNLYGKIFKNFETGEYKCFPYDLNQGYQKLIQETLENGYQEVYFNSFTMMELVEYLSEKKNSLIGIEYPFEDEDLEAEINHLTRLVKRKEIDWEFFKTTIMDELDDISKIKFRSIGENGFLLTIQKNGIVVVSEDAYEFVSNMICYILNGGL